VRFIGARGEVNAEEHCVKDNTIPLTLISILADGEFHSGEQLGEQLGMSRAAINKHIQTLRDWGVDVFTVPGKGYSCQSPSICWMKSRSPNRLNRPSDRPSGD
jgi:biotin operon repressor BirA-like protein